jgi:hypothetical protein
MWFSLIFSDLKSFWENLIDSFGTIFVLFVFVCFLSHKFWVIEEKSCWKVLFLICWQDCQCEYFRVSFWKKNVFNFPGRGSEICSRGTCTWSFLSGKAAFEEVNFFAQSISLIYSVFNFEAFQRSFVMKTWIVWIVCFMVSLKIWRFVSFKCWNQRWNFFLKFWICFLMQRNWIWTLVWKEWTFTVAIVLLVIAVSAAAAFAIGSEIFSQWRKWQLICSCFQSRWKSDSNRIWAWEICSGEFLARKVTSGVRCWRCQWKCSRGLFAFVIVLQSALVKFSCGELVFKVDDVS